MSKSKTSELEDYVRRLGEHINFMYSRINEINKKIKNTEEIITQLKNDEEENTEGITNLKENTVQKVEFDEFVSKLTESLRDLLPPLPPGAEETKKEGQ